MDPVDCAGRGAWTTSWTSSSRRSGTNGEDGRSVFVLVSGGVDSTVNLCTHCESTTPDRILGLYVDTGMMRKGESALVEESLQKAGLPNLRCHASAQFLGSARRA